MLRWIITLGPLNLPLTGCSLKKHCKHALYAYIPTCSPFPNDLCWNERWSIAGCGWMRHWASSTLELQTRFFVSLHLPLLLYMTMAWSSNFRNPWMHIFGISPQMAALPIKRFFVCHFRTQRFETRYRSHMWHCWRITLSFNSCAAESPLLRNKSLFFPPDSSCVHSTDTWSLCRIPPQHHWMWSSALKWHIKAWAMLSVASPSTSPRLDGVCGRMERSLLATERSLSLTDPAVLCSPELRCGRC